jgi:protein SCO1/2
VKRLVVVAVVVVAGVVGAVAIAAWPSREPEFVGSQPPVRISLPGFALRDHTGRLVRSRDLRGKVAVVTFLETKCREACPIIAERLRAAAGELSRDDVAFVAISTHPGDDTPASVAAFLRRHRAGGVLRYLIGTEAELRPVWRSFQVLAAIDSGSADVHSAPVRIYDAEGTWRSTLHAGADLTAANLVSDVRAALDAA